MWEKRNRQFWANRFLFKYLRCINKHNTQKCHLWLRGCAILCLGTYLPSMAFIEILGSLLRHYSNFTNKFYLFGPFNAFDYCFFSFVTSMKQLLSIHSRLYVFFFIISWFFFYFVGYCILEFQLKCCLLTCLLVS